VTEPLLRVEDLHVTFSTARGRIEAVRGVTFDIQPGEILALVGESGSGKSVTARALVGLAGSQAQTDARTITLAGHDGGIIDLRRLSSRSWRAVRGREIGFVLQDALVSLDPLRTIGREIAEPLLVHEIVAKADVVAEVKALLLRAGIPDPDIRAKQYPHELSGGLRQRALIASALAGRPRLLIADEPTTALDVTIQQQILSVFADLARAGHGVLLITHDLAVAAQIAHRIAVMQNGVIVEAGPARPVLAAPTHPYTQRLRAAVPGTTTRGRHLPREGSKPILDVDDVRVSFRRRDGSVFDALAGTSLVIHAGETVGIVGESGSGKTTLAKVALALQRPDRGEVHFDSHPWSAATESARRPLRRQIQTIVQDPFSSFDPRYSVERIIEQPLRLRGDLDRRGRRRRIDELMDLVSLPHELLDRRPTTLSGGQRQRVSIAQALASTPKLLVCDEPVSALDVTTQAQVLELLIGLQEQLGLAMLFISHDLGVIRQISHRIAVMEGGHIVEAGATDEIFANPRHPYTRRLLTAVPRLPEDATGK
jgi:peptide/nickel transport system ATP-binding protein